jgi:hypothetical protein
MALVSSDDFNGPNSKTKLLTTLPNVAADVRSAAATEERNAGSALSASPRFAAMMNLTS